MKKYLSKLLVAMATVWVILALPTRANAGVFELSAGLSFNDSDYGNGNYEWTRRWGASLGYHFTEISELEFAFQDVTDRTVIAGMEDTLFHDQIYSLDWVQAFAGRSAPIQPYVKFGVGQLNREASGSYVVGAPPAILDEVTVILGAGLRLFLTKTFALRAEGTTYLIGGNINTWSNNFAVTVGVSFFF